MLILPGHQYQCCDGLSRRGFLQIGALAFGGLTLPQLLRAESQSGGKATGKSVINIFLSGGPTHMDTFDLKPQAPSEFRGEFLPIKTNSPGLEICELMPELSTVGNQFSIIRSVENFKNEHNARQSDSGWSVNSLKNIGGRPGIGSVMSKIMGPAQVTPEGAAPTNLDLSGSTRPGFLGPMHSAFRPNSRARGNLILDRRVTRERLDDRTQLLKNLDGIKRAMDASGRMTAIDSFTERAMGIITSGKLAEALETKNEDPRTKEMYGIGRDRYSRSNESFLKARRLLEAGVRCVSLNFGSWDTHGKNFDSMRKQLPPLSKALSALIIDLDRTGRLDDTIIMMSGEFGRTPRVNRNAGRDHWNRAGFFFIAGGGMQHGQAIGKTNRLGEFPQERPVKLQHIFHTVYHQLGIDANNITFTDPNGRPQYIVEERELIHELI